MIDFKNKKILITGATGGIGGSLVKKFISLNGDVLGTGTKEDKLNLLKKKIQVLKFKNLIFLNIQKLKNLLILPQMNWAV